MKERWISGFRLYENVLVPVALACAVGTVLILANSNFPFANDGNCDPWFVFGRFFNADQLAALGHTRESSRIPLFIIGYITTWLFHGVTADYANFFILYVSAVVAVYFMARRLFGFVPAFVATVFFATNPQIIGNYAVTFSGPAITFSAIAMAFAIASSTMTREFTRTLALLTAGFFWGMAVHAHLYSLSFNFIVTLYCLDWSRRLNLAFLREAITRWALLFLGALLATAFFGVINAVVFHGDFFFFWDQYRAIFIVQIFSYDKANWYLLGGHGALVLMGAATICIQWLWVWRRGRTAPDVPRVLTALVPYSALLLVQVLYLLYGGLTLQYDYYIVWSIAPFVLLISSLVSRAAATRIATIAALTIYLVASVRADFGVDFTYPTITSFSPSLAIALIFAIIMVAVIKYPTRTILASLVLFVALNATIRTEKFGLPFWYGGGGGHDSYARIRDGLSFISGYRFPVLPKFWINAGGPLGETVAYPRSYGQCLVDVALPNFLTPASPYYSPGTEIFDRGDYIVMVAANSRDVTEAIANLGRRHLSLRTMGNRTVAYDGVSYLITVGQLY